MENNRHGAAVSNCLFVAFLFRVASLVQQSPPSFGIDTQILDRRRPDKPVGSGSPVTAPGPDTPKGNFRCGDSGCATLHAPRDPPQLA